MFLESLERWKTHVKRLEETPILQNSIKICEKNVLHRCVGTIHFNNTVHFNILGIVSYGLKCSSSHR